MDVDEDRKYILIPYGVIARNPSTPRARAIQPYVRTLRDLDYLLCCGIIALAIPAKEGATRNGHNPLKSAVDEHVDCFLS